ncbi:MAG: hypothetical protein M1822_008972 [Bathelium mastoideum]|nr:MAG: hypothetical protein M1822_008972 [Bathelium mastoideum]
MTYGGSNWGNLGYHGGSSSYDYGAAITEDRLVWREKYSELKLQSNFFKVSPAYLTATPGNEDNGTYGSSGAIGITPLFGNGSQTNFYVTRHADYTSNDTTTYQLKVPTSAGNLTLPQLGGSLTLFGRDAKIHVTDYDVGGINMLYSTAEVYSWTHNVGNKTLLVLYGGADETHEAAFPTSLGSARVSEGSDVTTQQQGSYTILHWTVTPQRRVVQLGNLEVHLLWRNEAYNYWVMELPAAAPVSNYTAMSKQLAIIKAGYLLRSADVVGSELRLSGDVNTTTNLEVISVPRSVNQISFNGELLSSQNSGAGRLSASVAFNPPNITVPDLTTLQWKYINSLPETQSNYSDALWTPCNQTYSNENRTLTTPTSLYASDYGYHTGSLLFRAHFQTTPNTTTNNIYLNTTGGVGFAHSVWLDSTFLGSWTGNGSLEFYAQNLTVPASAVSSTNAEQHVLTVLIDHMGQDEEAPGTDAIKFPRGILDFDIAGVDPQAVRWVMTGNLGGERYLDKARGPRNEGAMFAERQGYHLPNLPSQGWAVASPVADGLAGAGVGFYATSFELNVPSGWDVPMSFVFNTSAADSASGPDYRCQLFVNGYQFGKYVNNLGPQTVFPVPEGILNHNGRNDIALTLWALDASGAKVGGLQLEPQRVIKSGYSKPGLSPMPGWTLRDGAY